MTDVASAFSGEPLIGKSRVFIGRAFAARDQQDEGCFHLWAALALELLAKSTLARLHPVLVADPNNVDSLFAACGKSVGPGRKTIGASAAYGRCQKLVEGFDKGDVDFCNLLAERRNEDLHSGSVAERSAEQWLPDYWEVCRKLLVSQGLDLADWVGPDEASAAVGIIDKRISVIEHTVAARVKKCRTEFESRYPEGSAQRLAIAKSPAHLIRQMTGTHDSYWTEKCPACGLLGTVGADIEAEDVGEPEESGDGSWVELVTREYSHQSFRCDNCGLILRGVRELGFAGLETESEDEEEREPEGVFDYGND